MSTCEIPECDRVAQARGWCSPHYKRWRRWGNPLGSRVMIPAEDRFWVKVDKSGPTPHFRPGLGNCWQWTAGKTAQGYGGFYPSRGKQMLAHRYAYELVVGPIPHGLFIDHLCRNRACVNPDHLEPVTNEENLRRGAGFGLRNGMRRECIHGHEYTPENTYIDRRRNGVRCRECARIRDRARLRNRKAA